MKKKTLVIIFVLASLLLSTSIALADKPTGFDAQGNEIKWVEAKDTNGQACTKIQDGTLFRSDGVIITTGFDEWGYNYQGHLFNGGYCDAYRGAAWCQPYKDVELLMKWNDAWLSNVDCDGDGLLDRHYGFDSYIGSGAWTTNHQSGSYVLDGQTCNWNYFVKIVAAPSDAYVAGGVWYNADEVEIGPSIWGDFAIIQQVENDPCAGLHGLQYNSPDNSGLGGW
jgi:hypothetical protein